MRKVKKESIAYVNGEFTPLEKASISILDRGFLFADAVYEVIPVFEGVPLWLDQHLQRLKNSSEQIFLKPPLSMSEWKKIISELLAQNGLNQPLEKTWSVYLQVTRGIQSQRQHAIPENPTPTVIAFINPMSSKTLEEIKKGFSAITQIDTRHSYAAVKSTALLGNLLLLQTAKEKGAFESILLRDGSVTEAVSSNVFVVKNGKMFTPPRSEYLLGGITRDVFLQIAQEKKIPCEETEVSEKMLREADEILLTSSSKECFPVVVLDGQPVGDGKVGAMWQQMYRYYQEFKQNYIKKFK